MLRQIPIFVKLEEEDLRNLEKNITIKKYHKKETIFCEGDNPEFLYIIIKGIVKISKLAKDGREIVIEIIDQNDFFGALAVIKNIPYPANAIAVENSEIAKIPSKVFLSVMKKYPHIEAEILHHVTMRLKSGIESLKNIAIEDVSSRIAYQLLKLAKKYGRTIPEGVLIDIRITKQELADMTGTTTETAIRVISKLKKLEYLSEKDHKFVIKDIRAISSFI